MSTSSSLQETIAKFQRDRFAVLTGLEILEAAPGYAKVKLEIREELFNAVDIVQGGALFTLGDFAFAVAANTDANESLTSVAIESSISFVKPAKSGVLFAEAREIARSKSLVSYDVPITNEKGELIAKFYGRGFIRNPNYKK